MSLLEPTSVALIGASEDASKVGHVILKNLSDTYKGKIFPVNPKHNQILGKKCYHSISEVDGAVDLAIIVTPAATVLPIAEECGKKKVKTLLVISAGFGELGTFEGKQAEEKLADTAKKYAMRVIGPNCLGILRPGIGLNASFGRSPKIAGNVALVSQSGAMIVALLDRAERDALGFSFVASIGNKADLSESDFLELLEADEKTAVIGLYLESIKDGRQFVEAAKKTGMKKPIVLIKSGVSAAGAKAVSSHTGALAGSTAALDAACKEAGILRTKSLEEFVNALAVLSSEPPIPSPTIAIVTNAGGPGVLAVDAMEGTGLRLAQFEKKTVSVLEKSLPDAASVKNPVDVLGDANAERYIAALKAVADDGDVEGLAVLLTPQVMTPTTEIASAIVDLKKTRRLLPITTSFVGGTNVEAGRAILRKGGIPTYETPEEAVKALATLKRPLVDREDGDDPKGDDRSSAANGLLKKKKGALSAELAAELFSLYGLPVPMQALAKTEKDAMNFAEEIGYPVIAKISSKDILHKTDIGGVRADLQDAAAVKKAFAEITKNAEKARPDAAIDGVLIQKFLPAGSEFIIGGVRDPVFGPLVMVGLGGIYAELFKDVTFRLAPVSIDEAYRMLSELTSWKMLLGMRGKKALDIDALASAVRNVSLLMHDCPMISEVDVNPILVREDSIVALDTKVVLN